MSNRPTRINAKRCEWCNTNSDHLKRINGRRLCPSCADRELKRIDCFSQAPFTGWGF